MGVATRHDYCVRAIARAREGPGDEARLLCSKEKKMGLFNKLTRMKTLLTVGLIAFFCAVIYYFAVCKSIPSYSI